MTPDTLARIHKACFTMPRPWSSVEFADLLAHPAVFLSVSQNGFALGRVVGPEAELLTIAILPDAQNMGEGRQLLQAFIESAAARHVQEIFLEVAETNFSALRLYQNCGFTRIGARAGYYKTGSTANVAAIVMKMTI